MNQRTKAPAIAIVVTLIVVIGIVSIASQGLAREPGNTTSLAASRGGGDEFELGSSDKVVMQGYPGPTPTATSTPVVGGSGYFAPPSNVVTATTSITASPYSDLLVPLHAELSSGDAASIAGRVQGVGTGLGIFAGQVVDAHKDATADQTRVETDLGSFFLQGASPKIQGYFVESAQTAYPCMYVFLWEWAGTVSFPSGPDYSDGWTDPPALYPEGASFWQLCRRDVGSWTWKEWGYGGYYEMITVLDDVVDDPYYVVRP